MVISESFSILCDCRSLRLPITVKRFSVRITTECFPTNLVQLTIQRVKLIFLKFRRPLICEKGETSSSCVFAVYLISWHVISEKAISSMK